MFLPLILFWEHTHTLFNCKRWQQQKNSHPTNPALTNVLSDETALSQPRWATFFGIGKFLSSQQSYRSLKEKTVSHFTHLRSMEEKSKGIFTDREIGFIFPKLCGLFLIKFPSISESWDYKAWGNINFHKCYSNVFQKVPSIILTENALGDRESHWDCYKWIIKYSRVINQNNSIPRLWQ